MNMKDRLALRNWKGATLSDVESISRIGLVENERFTPRSLRTFRLLHTWGGVRFSSSAQDMHFLMHGMNGINRRIARVQRLAKAIWG